MTHQFLTNHKQYYKGCQLRRPFGLVGLSNNDEQVLEQCNVHSWQKNAVKERLYKIETINVKTTCTGTLLPGIYDCINHSDEMNCNYFWNTSELLVLKSNYLHYFNAKVSRCFIEVRAWVMTSALQRARGKLPQYRNGSF